MNSGTDKVLWVSDTNCVGLQCLKTGKQENLVCVAGVRFSRPTGASSCWHLQPWWPQGLWQEEGLVSLLSGSLFSELLWKRQIRDHVMCMNMNEIECFITCKMLFACFYRKNIFLTGCSNWKINDNTPASHYWIIQSLMLYLEACFLLISLRSCMPTLWCTATTTCWTPR